MVVTRIAPSPTGDPHVGTAYIGLFNYLVARQGGGKFILRIEDTDRTRLVPGAEDRIFSMMHWLGLSPDESPEVGGPSGPYRQSERYDLYQEYARKLLDSGHAYRAFETPEQLSALREAAGGGIFAVPSRELAREESDARAAAGESFVIRLKVPRAGETVVRDRLRDPIVFRNAEIDDKVLLKSDGFPTYHLANVVDDHLMGVTHVIRAEEWITSTPIHVLLYAAFGWNEPQWYHMPLLRNNDKTKISKRKNHTSAEWYRAQGFFPEAMLNFLATMGWTHPEGKEIFDLEEMQRVFDIGRITLGGPIFDLERLKWVNGKYMREVFSPEEVSARLHAYLEEHGHHVPQDAYFQQVVRMMIPRIEVFSEFWDKSTYFWTEDYPFNDKAKKLLEDARDLLPELRTALGSAPDFAPATTEALLRGFAETKGLKPGKVMQPLRAAVAGTSESPGMFEMLEALGRERVLARLDRALGVVGAQ
ncbi:glutamyl-tRNA synthetase [Deinobacterium chartae]|uniref:Glutamate--tRNA ligase n=1 Tax=Deinobacterium chartae TaxID=521158 RepID=A0A841I5R6_9DEIO|nr:glutamate--tRNA ligase [Deinobacterium chartae]MBB6099788.1 glutamyl-tRNA synthetase [Deinobacterium chartae]